MSKKRAYQSYSREFKVEAVALVTQQGCSVPEAAASLGVRIPCKGYLTTSYVRTWA